MSQENSLKHLHGIINKQEKILCEIAALVGMDASADYSKIPDHIRGDDGRSTIFDWISGHLAVAQAKHPDFALSYEHGFRVVQSEMLEWQAAALLGNDSDRRRDRAMTEAAHCVVVLLRWIDMMHTTYQSKLPPLPITKQCKCEVKNEDE